MLFLLVLIVCCLNIMVASSDPKVCEDSLRVVIVKNVDSIKPPAIVLVMNNWIMSCPVYGMDVQQGLAHAMGARYVKMDSIFIYFWTDRLPASEEELVKKFSQLLDQASFPPGSVKTWCVIR